MFVSVDLPMPGEPPSSTSEPGHEPAAEHAVQLADAGQQPRLCFSAATSDEPRGPARRGRAAPRRARSPWPASPRASSASVFHSPQPGHCPIQRGVSAAQAEQTKTVVARGMLMNLGAGADGFAPRAVGG